MLKLQSKQQPRKIRHLPKYDSGNAWYNILPPPPPAHVLDKDEAFDWAILGAGACGLAVARRLGELRPDDSIALLEASRVGYGASGRNSGFMLNHNTHGEVKNLEIERRNSQLCDAGARYLKSLVEQHSIDCDWSDWGRLYVAASEDGDHHLSELQENYQTLDILSDEVDHNALAEMLGTSFYRRALMVKGNGLVNPAALMRGLGNSLPANVTLYENSPIAEVVTGSRHVLSGSDGTIRAKNLILANSVFLQDTGILARHIVPIATFASLSKPLTADQRTHLGTEKEFALLPAHPNGSTIRLTRDNRLLMRNTIRYAPAKQIGQTELDTVFTTLQNSIAQRWPQLQDLQPEGYWGGMLGFTRNDGTIWGELRERVYGVISSDASPVTRGSIAGKLLAEDICGVDSELLSVMQSFPRAAILPPDPILRFVLNRRIKGIEKSGVEEI